MLFKTSFYTNSFTFELQLCYFSIANLNNLRIVPNEGMLPTIAHANRLFNLPSHNLS